jgi:hypothetical protein
MEGIIARFGVAGESFQKAKIKSLPNLVLTHQAETYVE